MNNTLVCPVCDQRTRNTCGYGLAAGPIGAYTFCDACDYLIDFMPDSDHIEDEEEMKQLKIKNDAALYYHIECARIQYAHESRLV